MRDRALRFFIHPRGFSSTYKSELMASSDNTQTPIQQIAERAAETHPALSAAAAAVGLQNHRQALTSHEQRVRDSHKAQMQALGLQPDERAEDMGDILITGDISSSNPAELIDTLRGLQREQQQQPKKSVLPAALLALASLATGVSAPYLLPEILSMLVKAPVDTQQASSTIESSVTEVTVENDYPMQVFREP